MGLYFAYMQVRYNWLNDIYVSQIVILKQQNDQQS